MRTPPAPLILAFGDSLTAGYGLARDESFAAQLEALLRARRAGGRVINAGVSGDTSSGGRARLGRVLTSLTHRPDLAIVELGANDFLRGLAAESLRANLDAILGELARCGIPVLLAGIAAPAFLGPRAAAFGRVFPELAARHGVPLYPHFLDGVAGLPGLTLADGLHPNARAIGIVAARILPHVEAALAGTVADAA
jgi:acyl-CoA thioesterase-1